MFEERWTGIRSGPSRCRPGTPSGTSAVTAPSLVRPLGAIGHLELRGVGFGSVRAHGKIPADGPDGSPITADIIGLGLSGVGLWKNDALSRSVAMASNVSGDRVVTPPDTSPLVRVPDPPTTSASPTQPIGTAPASSLKNAQILICLPINTKRSGPRSLLGSLGNGAGFRKSDGVIEKEFIFHALSKGVACHPRFQRRLWIWTKALQIWWRDPWRFGSR